MRDRINRIIGMVGVALGVYYLIVVILFKVNLVISFTAAVFLSMLSLVPFSFCIFLVKKEGKFLKITKRILTKVLISSVIFVSYIIIGTVYKILAEGNILEKFTFIFKPVELFMTGLAWTGPLVVIFYLKTIFIMALFLLIIDKIFQRFQRKDMKLFFTILGVTLILLYL